MGNPAFIEPSGLSKTGLHTCYLRFNLYGVKKGSLPSWKGTRRGLQQDALHLQVVESFLATFVIVILITSFQDFPGVALKKVRTENSSITSGPIATATPAFF